MRKKIVYIDMDKVTCDFTDSYQKAIKKNPYQIYPHCEYGFFLNLSLIEGAKESIEYLKTEFDVWFLSRPSTRNLLCYTEKAAWIRNHFGYEMQKKLILATNKSLLKGDYLIDDSTNANQEQFEGKLIRFGSKGFPDWKTVTDYFKKNYMVY